DRAPMPHPLRASAPDRWKIHPRSRATSRPSPRRRDACGQSRTRARRPSLPAEVDVRNAGVSSSFDSSFAMVSGPAGAGLIVLPSEVFSDTAPAPSSEGYRHDGGSAYGGHAQKQADKKD